ncbi:unnamed protein product [Sphagnum troendelagicum]|uniref:Uncharacterized protein n=1 Tax=Sphagnum troendelagicum TaxID=128251 RepID=A0ABP0THQ7_9BRYO
MLSCISVMGIVQNFDRRSLVFFYGFQFGAQGRKNSLSNRCKKLGSPELTKGHRSHGYLLQLGEVVMFIMTA